MIEEVDELKISGEVFNSRLFLGTGKFQSGEILSRAVFASESQMVTVAMKRANPNAEKD